VCGGGSAINPSCTGPTYCGSEADCKARFEQMFLACLAITPKPWKPLPGEDFPHPDPPYLPEEPICGL
jgi:hypothetical protein